MDAFRDDFRKALELSRRKYVGVGGKGQDLSTFGIL
jgi:hypothetical protein